MNDDFQIWAHVRNRAEVHFTFLLEHGFQFSEEESVESPTIAKVGLAARRVALILSFDRRDEATALHVAQVREGHILHRGEGGYYSEFTAYLRRRCGFRGSISDGMPFPQVKALSLGDRIDRDIRLYAQALNAYAPAIVNDTEEFSPSPSQGPEPP